MSEPNLIKLSEVCDAHFERRIDCVAVANRFLAQQNQLQSELLNFIRLAALEFIRRAKPRNQPAWVAVRNGFCVGSTTSSMLCIKCGINPETGECTV